MKFLFLDEFKYDSSKSHKIYGLTGIVIDSQYYLSFKESFSVALKKIGWDKKHELKGRSMFSTSGDKSVDVKERVNFMSDVVGISKSKSGKTAKIHVFVAMEMYEYPYNLMPYVKAFFPAEEKDDLLKANIGDILVFSGEFVTYKKGGLTSYIEFTKSKVIGINPSE